MESTLKNRALTLLMLVIALLPMQLAHSKQNLSLTHTETPELRNLLYIYYTEPQLDALVKINAAAETDPNLASNTVVTIIRAELSLDLGYLDIAQTLLFSLSKNDIYKNELLVKLAAEQYKKRNFTASLNTLKKTSSNIDNELRNQYKLQMGMTQMALGNYREAANILDDSNGSPTVNAYAQYNLGIALLNSKKFDKGIQALNKLGNTNFIENELKNLKDRANVSLGYLHMQAQEPKIAKKYLERVRLSSKFSSQALLGMGLADIALENNKNALIPLLELVDQPASNQAVIESYLAVPHALTKLGSNKHAIDYYEQAINIYEQQLQASTALTDLLKKTRSSIREHLPHNQASLKTPQDILLARIATALIIDPDYATASANYAELSSLKSELPLWRNSYQDIKNASTLPVEKTSLDHRLTTLEKQVDATLSQHEVLLSELVLNELHKESTTLNQYINQARFSMAQIYENILNQRTAP